MVHESTLLQELKSEQHLVVFFFFKQLPVEVPICQNKNKEKIKTFKDASFEVYRASVGNLDRLSRLLGIFSFVRSSFHIDCQKVT